MKKLQSLKALSNFADCKIDPQGLNQIKGMGGGTNDEQRVDTCTGDGADEEQVLYVDDVVKCRAIMYYDCQ